MSADTTFDPSRYLTKINNADYLEVKWRLVWLRQTHPEAAVETELMSHDGSNAIFRARVTTPTGGSATGWGSEAMDDFHDYIEKAETKAIGRALAALGFGTQFCPEFEFGAASGRIVDAPIDFASTSARRRVEQAGADQERPIATVDQPATQRQIKFIYAIGREHGLDDKALGEEAEQYYGESVPGLGRRNASDFIERLQALPRDSALAS